jgi:hypothetical protein
LKNATAKPRNDYSVEARIVVILAAALVATLGWWLFSDREPTQKEMTFAYRKHVIAISRDLNLIELTELRERLHQIELIKRHCDKLKEKQYRCEAIVLADRRPTKGFLGAENAIYIRDAKGFEFESIEDSRN